MNQSTENNKIENVFKISTWTKGFQVSIGYSSRKLATAAYTKIATSFPYFLDKKLNGIAMVETKCS